MANKGRYAPSGSGLVDSHDYVQMKDAPFLQNVVVYVAERELREECTISREIRLDTVAIGYARLLKEGVSLTSSASHLWRQRRIKSKMVLTNTCG